MADGNLVLETFSEGSGLSYLVGDRAAGSFAVIDPHESLVQSYLQSAARANGKIQLVLETHLHEDHLSGASALKVEAGCEVVAGQGHPAKIIDRHLTGGVRIRLGGVSLSVLASPGHAAEAVCFTGPGLVFTGHTLLVGGCERTDLPGSDPRALYSSLRKLLSLPNETVIYPGRAMPAGQTSTIGKEKDSNPLLQIKDEATLVAHLKALNLPAPMNARYFLLCNERGFPEGREDLVPSDVFRLLENGQCTVIDVGTSEQHEIMRIEGSLSIPVEAITERWRELINCVPPLIVVSGSPGIAVQARSILEERGFLGVRCLQGGLRQWRKCRLPLYRRVSGLWGFRATRFFLAGLAFASGAGGLSSGSALGWLGLLAGGLLGLEAAAGKDLGSILKRNRGL